MSTIDAVMIGAGQRGREAIGGFAKRNPKELRFIAVAEVNEGRRNAFGELHRIPSERRFASAEELFSQPQLAPICFIMTMDDTHLEIAIPALEKGYHLFLEKPMADTPEGCIRIFQAAKEHQKMIQVCHPMRYTPFYKNVKNALNQGAIGHILSISMSENVAYWHFAHSYVRGNWSRVEDSTPMIIAKCCHDMDLATWLVDSPVETVASFGKLSYFREENAPEGAPGHCMEGCPVEETCPFYAPAVYLKDHIEWPVSVISLDTSIEARTKAIQEGSYGRCVFRCDNTAADHQVVCAQFENEVTLDFAVRGNTFHPFRTLRILGTEGEINGHAERGEFTVLRFVQGMGENPKPEIHRIPVSSEPHMGGDAGVITNFLRCIRENDTQTMDHSLDIALEGHMLAFAAEEARQSGAGIKLTEYKKRLS